MLFITFDKVNIIYLTIFTIRKSSPSYAMHPVWQERIVYSAVKTNKTEKLAVK